MDPSAQRSVVSEYYGKTLSTTSDLKTSACCPVGSVPAKHRSILAKLHPSVVSRFYGCGTPIPDFLSACTVLDLGCGAGRDAFLAAALVGPTGRVIGVDMTEPQLNVARDAAQFHAHTFFGDRANPNTDFRHGFIEDLTTANIQDAEIDVVISNCVCNLSADKKAVFAEVARVLKQGGEFYFADVYADRRLSDDARKHPVLVAECLGGAMYLDDFRRVMAEVGFCDVRVVASAPLVVHDDALSKLVKDVRFHSVTVRAFKIDKLEDRREKYGQVATYSACCGDGMRLDVDYNFVKGVPVEVDGNTAAILQHARFKDKFTVTERGRHEGLFWPAVEGGAFVGRVYAVGAETGKTATVGACCARVGNGTKEGNGCCVPQKDAEGQAQKGKGCASGSASC